MILCEGDGRPFWRPVVSEATVAPMASCWTCVWYACSPFQHCLSYHVEKMKLVVAIGTAGTINKLFKQLMLSPHYHLISHTGKRGIFQMELKYHKISLFKNAGGHILTMYFSFIFHYKQFQPVFWIDFLFYFFISKYLSWLLYPILITDWGSYWKTWMS